MSMPFNGNTISLHLTNLTNTTDAVLKGWNSNPSQRPVIETVTKWMWYLMPPVVIAMGTFGNVASLAVLRRVGVVGTTPINMYLFALALSDLVVLNTGLLRYWILELASYDIYSWHSTACKGGMWLGSCIINSTYLLVVLTIQRALSVIFPHRVHLMCTRRTTVALTGGTAAVSFLCMAHVPYGYDLVYEANSTRGTCGFASPDYFAFIDVLLYFQVVQVALFPFACLVISNSILAWGMLVSVSAAGLNVAVAVNTGHSEKVKERRKKASSTTITVMVMSLTFILSTLPFFINLLISSTDNLDAQHLLDVESIAADHFVQSLLTILFYCNSALNFYLYCLTGTKFRREFLNLFRGASKIQRLPSVQFHVTKDMHNDF